MKNVLIFSMSFTNSHSIFGNTSSTDDELNLTDPEQTNAIVKKGGAASEAKKLWFQLVSKY